MSKGIKRPHSEMYELAVSITGTLGQFCERIEIAGSLRRQRPLVGDIEIVAIPVRQPDLFGTPNLNGQTELGYFLNEKVKPDQWHRNGQKLKSWCHGSVQVDLYLPVTENWGWRYMLSTGSAEFNKWLVTKRAWGGAMPQNMESKDGFLWRDGKQLETKTERDVFDVMGLSFIPVTMRDDGDWSLYLQVQTS